MALEEGSHIQMRGICWRGLHHVFHAKEVQRQLVISVQHFQWRTKIWKQCSFRSKQLKETGSLLEKKESSKPSVRNKPVEAIRARFLSSQRQLLLHCANRLQLKMTTAHKVLIKHNFLHSGLQLLYAMKPNDSCKTCDYAENIIKWVGWLWSISFYITLFSVMRPDSRDISWECDAGRTHTCVLNTRMITLKATCCNWQGSRPKERERVCLCVHARKRERPAVTEHSFLDMIENFVLPQMKTTMQSVNQF